MFLCLLAVAMMLSIHTTAVQAKSPVLKNWLGVAVKGYDVVAYHTEGRAVKGKKAFSHKWNDAKWYFANAGNRDLFVAEPERYAPQYGGY